MDERLVDEHRAISEEDKSIFLASEVQSLVHQVGGAIAYALSSAFEMLHLGMCLWAFFSKTADKQFDMIHWDNTQIQRYKVAAWTWLACAMGRGMVLAAMIPVLA